MIEAKIDMLLRLLQRRTGKAVPSKLAAQIRQTTDQATLDQWLDVVLDLTSLDDFRGRINS